METESPTPDPTESPTPAPSTDAPTNAPTDSPSPAPSASPTESPSMAPTPPPTLQPTPLCPNLRVDIIGGAAGLEKSNFEGLYVFQHSVTRNSRPVFEDPQDPTDHNMQYIGVPPNGFWVIEGIGKGTLSYGPTSAYYPPYDEVSYHWTHNNASLDTVDILIGCVESFAPISAPTNAPTIAPSTAPTSPPTTAPVWWFIFFL